MGRFRGTLGVVLKVRVVCKPSSGCLSAANPHDITIFQPELPPLLHHSSHPIQVMDPTYPEIQHTAGLREAWGPMCAETLDPAGGSAQLAQGRLGPPGVTAKPIRAAQLTFRSCIISVPNTVVCCFLIGRLLNLFFSFFFF